PVGTARPCGTVARSTSPSSAPPPTAQRPVAGSTETELIAESSSTTPPSHVECPGKLWPPQRTLSRASHSAAARTTAATSCAVVGRTIAAGCRSTTPFQIRRRRSKSADPGTTRPPLRSAAFSRSTTSLATAGRLYPSEVSGALAEEGRLERERRDQ